MPAKTLMIQGTASHVGKSVLTAALCRLFLRRGRRVAPFKAQNMSNNSFVTPDGREIGRAQAVQAAACRLDPRSDFNPVLIKPETERRAQLVVNGRPVGSLAARDFGLVRRNCAEAVRTAFGRLAAEFDLVILEGAGSPAEINLRDCDIVNMWMAREAAAPVLLAGDIERGGVFAALVGTLTLLTPEERRHVKGLVINKFRGEPALLDPGVRAVEAQTGVPCLGVLPHWGDLRVPQEDSLGWEDLAPGVSRDARPDLLTIGVADLPSISNFTDLEPLGREPDVRLLRLRAATEEPLDALVVPGTKVTVEGLRFMRTSGLDRTARRVAEAGGLVVGLCGGYQILGRLIRDPLGVESAEREAEGLGLLDVATSFARKKVLVQAVGRHRDSGCRVRGYQVHCGRTRVGPGIVPLLDLEKPDGSLRWAEGALSPDGRVWGTYLHGLFDEPEFRRAFLNRLRAVRGWAPLPPSPDSTLDGDLDRLADFVERHLDMEAVERIVEAGA